MGEVYWKVINTDVVVEMCQKENMSAAAGCPVIHTQPEAASSHGG